MRNLIRYLFYRVFKTNIYSGGISLDTKLGKGVYISKNVEINYNSSVGNFSFIGKNTIISKTIIGNYCSIAPNCSIGLGEHNYNRLSTSSKLIPEEITSLLLKDCIIGNDVWIGVGVIILRGVKIGDGAVIGAGTIVTKDVEDYAIVVGSPGKSIKKRFNEKKIKQLKKSQWWMFDPDNAKGLLKKIEDEHI